jgi:hypothetical protein
MEILYALERDDLSLQITFIITSAGDSSQLAFPIMRIRGYLAAARGRMTYEHDSRAPSMCDVDIHSWHNHWWLGSSDIRRTI